MLKHSCCLRIAYELKEEFRQIYQTARTPESGKRRFQTWLNHAQQLYQESSQTIRDHKDGICNYFINHSSSGAMEGINNRIQLIKRQGYGNTQTSIISEVDDEFAPIKPTSWLTMTARRM